MEHFISEKCLHRNVVMVGFHVRRADYRFYRNGAYYYEDVAWLSWIRQARRAFRSNAKRFVGLISSDEDVSSLVNSADDLIRVPGGTYEDLCLLSKCHYLIGPTEHFFRLGLFHRTRSVTLHDKPRHGSHPGLFSSCELVTQLCPRAGIA